MKHLLDWLLIIGAGVGLYFAYCAIRGIIIGIVRAVRELNAYDREVRAVKRQEETWHAYLEELKEDRNDSRTDR